MAEYGINISVGRVYRLCSCLKRRRIEIIDVSRKIMANKLKIYLDASLVHQLKIWYG